MGGQTVPRAVSVHRFPGPSAAPSGPSVTQALRRVRVRGSVLLSPAPAGRPAPAAAVARVGPGGLARELGVQARGLPGPVAVEWTCLVWAEPAQALVLKVPPDAAVVPRRPPRRPRWTEKVPSPGTRSARQGLPTARPAGPRQSITNSQAPDRAARSKPWSPPDAGARTPCRASGQGARAVAVPRRRGRAVAEGVGHSYARLMAHSGPAGESLHDTHSLTDARLPRFYRRWTSPHRGVAQLARVPVSKTGGCRFDPDRPCH